MRLLSASLVLLVLTWASWSAAQPAPVAPSPKAPEAAPSPAEPAFGCRLGDSRGIPDADASTASFLMCRELSRASHDRGSFEVVVRPLGSLVLAAVTRLDTHESRTATLASLAEIVVAAPRLADALVEGRPLEDTRRVQSVLASEAAAPKSIAGQRHIALHVIAMAPLGTGSFGVGAGFGYLYEMPRWSVGGHLDIAGADDARNGRGFMSVAIGSGVRHFLGERDVAPFVGAGLSLQLLSTQMPNGSPETYGYVPSDTRSATLLAPFVEGGASVFRTTRGRFVASVRVEAPLGRVEHDGWGDLPVAPKYVLPVSFRVGAQF